MVPSNIISGFEKCGVYPFNPDAVVVESNMTATEKNTPSDEERESTSGEKVLEDNGEESAFFDFTLEEEMIFEWRYEEGYDLHDPHYLLWLQNYHPDASSATLPPVDTHLSNSVAPPPFKIDLSPLVVPPPFETYLSPSATLAPISTHLSLSATLPPTETHLSPTVAPPTVETHLSPTVAPPTVKTHLSSSTHCRDSPLSLSGFISCRDSPLSLSGSSSY